MNVASAVSFVWDTKPDFPSIICFDSNSQTSEPIRSPKSPTVDLEVEEQEESQGSLATEEEGE